MSSRRVDEIQHEPGRGGALPEISIAAGVGGASRSSNGSDGNPANSSMPSASPRSTVATSTSHPSARIPAT